MLNFIVKSSTFQTVIYFNTNSKIVFDNHRKIYTVVCF